MEQNSSADLKYKELQESIEAWKAHQQQLAAEATKEQVLEEKSKNQAGVDAHQVAPQAGCCNIQ